MYIGSLPKFREILIYFLQHKYIFTRKKKIVTPSIYSFKNSFPFLGNFTTKIYI